MWDFDIQNGVLIGYSGELPNELHIPEDVSIIAKGVFRGVSIQELYIPRTVEDIQEDAFMECNELHHVYFDFGSNIRCLGNRSFYCCKSLITIETKDFTNVYCLELPNGLKEIGDWCFYCCYNLNSISLPCGLTNLGRSAFAGCSSLLSIVIPKTVETIPSCCFEDCHSLILFTWEYKGDEIHTYYDILKGCESLQEVYTYYHPYYFYDIVQENPNLKYIHYLGTLYPSMNVLHERQKHEMFLQCMSQYYDSFGMNLSQMKRTNQYGDKYKKPCMWNWEEYTSKKMPQDALEDWSQATGIGLILGYNNYRAIDVDLYVDISEIKRRELIKDFINALELPDEYPWIVNSGGGKGFHIIFKCSSYENEEETISYQFHNHYKLKFTNEERFGAIELRWKDHIVLPPSSARYGGEYTFLYDSLPQSLPEEIELSNIDCLLDYVASEHCFTKRNVNNIEYEVASRKKIFEPWDSWRDAKWYNEDPMSWLETSNTVNCQNLVLLRYLDSDPLLFENYAKNILLQTETKDIYFNLASLMSTGLLTGSVKAIDYCYERLVSLFGFEDDKDDNEADIQELTEYQNHFELIDNNARNLQISKGKLYLFVDTETTGLALGENVDYTDWDNWPRLVQISWIVSTENGIVLRENTSTIYPQGFVIPEDSSRIHGIYQDDAEMTGENLVEVLAEFSNDVERCDVIAGHNISFDVNVLLAEMMRLGNQHNEIELLKSKDQACTMKSSVNFCHILAHRGFKYPTLQQLHMKLFGNQFEDAHDASSDIQATFKCFWKLREKNII